MPHPNPSDIVLTIDLVLAVIFALYFAIGKPRAWFRDRLGWVIFGYALAVIALLTLIVYALWTGERIAEPARLGVGSALGAALVAKTWSVYRERHQGRIAPANRRHPERIAMSPLSAPTPSDAVKNVTEIWYKAQRVLRTLVQVIIPAFLGFAVVLPLIIEALGLPVDSELRLWLLLVAGGVTAVATAIARVMAIPAVNAWLIKIGLGSVPASAVYVSPATGTVQVKTDPKARG